MLYDTRASCSLSPCKEDFISWEIKGVCATIKGIYSDAKVMDIGKVKWLLSEDDGNIQQISNCSSLCTSM